MFEDDFRFWHFSDLSRRGQRRVPPLERVKLSGASMDDRHRKHLASPVLSN
jgi:hypothetical protein